MDCYVIGLVFFEECLRSIGIMFLGCLVKKGFFFKVILESVVLLFWK